MSATTQKKPAWLTYAAAVAEFGYPDSQLRRMVACRQIKSNRIGHRTVLVSRSSLENLAILAGKH